MTAVTIVNFSHPLTEMQLTDIAEAVGGEVSQVIDVPTQFDRSAPLDGQCRALIGATGLIGREWQTHPIVVNLPSLSIAAAVMLAELHGLMGHFPAVLDIRPVEGSLPRRFELAGVIELNAFRVRGAAQVAQGDHSS